MSQVTYNNVTLPFPMHTSFNQEAVYDDQGQTDRIYTKFDVTVQTLLNTNYISTIDATIAVGSNPATIMKAIRQKLLQHRKQLQVQVGGVDLIPANQTGNNGTVDAKNGPQPQSCNIQQITDVTFLVQWRVIAHYWENNTAAAPNTNSAGDNVLFNRWTESVSIDECNYSKIERTGVFCIRSDNVDGKMADDIREQMAAVSIPTGFKRTMAKYTIQPDGLRLSYHTIDEEVFLQPPSPAFKADGRYTEETTLMGAKRSASIRLTLEGSKESDQSALLQTAVQICVNKINLEAKSTNARAAILEMGKIETEMYRNKVTVELRCLMTPLVPPSRPPRQNDRAGDGAKALSLFAVPRLLVDPEIAGGDGPPPVGLRGNANGANWLLTAAAYYDPSIQKHTLDIQRQIQPNDGNIGTLR